jgi:ATP-dependent Clp protease ATP-binding subunit ClpC
MKENFSKGVQRVLKFAKEEAVRLGHSYVGSEHLLLGIIKDNKGKAANILTSIGCDIQEMKIMIEDMAKPSGGTMTLGHLPLTRRAERILRTTFSEAQNYKEDIADQMHLLLALSREDDGLATEVLSAYTIDYELLSTLSTTSPRINEKIVHSQLYMRSNTYVANPSSSLDNASRRCI